MALRWAVCGTGKMAEKFLQTLKRCQKQVAAIISSDLKRAKNFASLHDIQSYYSYSTIDYDSFDVVYVATVNKRHMEDSCMFLQQGKSVLCEKPIAVNLEQLQTMISTADQNKALLVEALWTAFLPAIHKAKELIDDGLIGKVTHLDSRFCIYIPKSKSRLYDQNGGGALLDIGIYNLFLAKYILGDFADIKTNIKYDNQGIDLVDKISITSTQGGTANLISSIRKKLPVIKAVITGQKGKIILPFFIGANKVILKTQKTKTFSYPHKINGYEYEIEHFENLHKNNLKQSPIFSLKDSYNLLDTMQKILNSKKN